MKVVSARPLSYAEQARMAKEKVPDKPVVHLGKYGVCKVYDNYKPIADIRKSTKTCIRVSIGTRDGYRYVILREFYKKDKREEYEDEWMPGREGMIIPLTGVIFSVDDPPKFINVCETLLEKCVEAMHEAETMELYDKENALYRLKSARFTDHIKFEEDTK